MNARTDSHIRHLLETEGNHIVYLKGAFVLLDGAGNIITDGLTLNELVVNYKLREENMRPNIKPSRKDLLAIITECQNLFGRISGAFADTNPNRAADIERLTKEGFELCVNARRHDPP